MRTTSTTRLTETQLKDILKEYFNRNGTTLTGIRVGREDYGGDPREQSCGYVECTIEIEIGGRP